MLMRKIVAASTLTSALACIFQPAHAGLPVSVVFDATATANQLQNYAQYVQQLAELKNQLTQLKATYDALNGLRNVGNLMSNDLMAQYLPPDYQQAYQALRSGQSGSLSGVSGTLNQIAAQNQSQSCAASNTNPANVASCNQAWQTMAMNQYVGQAGYAQAAANITKLGQFLNAITTAADPKSMMDLQARIQVEQIKMQNEQMKLQTVAMMQKADEAMQRSRDAQLTGQMLSNSTEIRWGANRNRN